MKSINTFKERLNKAFIAISRIVAAIDRDRVMVYAAQASYFVLMSAVPFIMLFVLAIGVLVPLDSAQIAALTIEFLPEQLRTSGVKFLSEIFNQINIPVISITSAIILWAASKGIRSIGDGIQNIYDEKKARGYIKNALNSLLYTVAFIVTIALSVVILVFGAPLQNLINSYLGENAAFLIRLLNLKNIIFAVMLTFLFMISYKGLAKSNMPINAQFFGAALAALGWIVFSSGFSIYIKYFSNYPILYGGLATLLLFMLWLFMCMVILLLGAEVNKWRYNLKHPAKHKNKKSYKGKK